MRKGYSDQTLKLNRKFEKTDIKHKRTLLDLQFLKICEDHNVIPTFLRLKLLILICAILLRTDNVKKKVLREETWNKKIVVSQIDRESKLLYNVKSNLNLTDIHHFLNISLISNEKELEQINFRDLSSNFLS